MYVKQFRVRNSADYTINSIAESYVGIIDAKPSKQVIGFSFVFHTDSSLFFDTNLTVYARRGIIK